MYESFYTPQTTKGEVPGNCSQNWCCRHICFWLFKGVGVGFVFLSVGYTSWRTPSPVSLPPSPLKQWRKPNYSGHIDDYTTQLGGDYNKPWHYKDPYIKQPMCQDVYLCFFPLLKCCRRSTKRCDVTMATLQVKWKPWHKHSVPWDHGVERWRGSVGW